MGFKTSTANNFPNSVEFFNNGVSDSLTGAPAPKAFFDNLIRDVSNSQRKSQPLSIITVKLLPIKVAGKSIGKGNLDIRNRLVLISNCIKSNMRGGDFYARMAENGFWVCIQGNLAEAAKASERLERRIIEKVKSLDSETRVEISMSEWQKGFAVKNWIDEVDLQYFS